MTIESQTPLKSSDGDSERISSVIQPLAEMLREIIKMSPDSIPDPHSDAQRPDSRVMEKIQQRLREWDINIDEGNTTYKKPLGAGYSIATTAFHHVPTNIQAEIALYTFLVVAIDDGLVDEAALRQFVPRFCSGSPQLHPILDRLVESCHGITTLFAEFGANIIYTNTMDFVNAELYLTDDQNTLPGSLSNDSVAFINHIRASTGISLAYATFIYPKAEFPEAKDYAQAYPDMVAVINLLNDIFSYYKELKAGESSNLVSTLATAKHTTALEEVRGLVQCVPDALTRVRGLVAKGKARNAWEKFFTGYIRFHLSATRYQLSEILPELNL